MEEARRYYRTFEEVLNESLDDPLVYVEYYDQDMVKEYNWVREVMQHPVRVEGYNGSLKELAAAVAGMRYDKVEEFLGHLAQEFYQQAERDAVKGRVQLAAQLRDADDLCEALKHEFETIWELCVPYTIEKVE